MMQYRTVMRALGVERAVLVQPSVYGTDNSALLDALNAGGSSFRGVAVLSPDTSHARLKEMHDLGVRGVRLNLVNPPVLAVDDAISLSRSIAPLGWHLQVQLRISREGCAQLIHLAQHVAVPLVLDHVGLPDSAALPAELMWLLRRGQCWIKLSGLYRSHYLYARPTRLAALVAMLLDANPQQLLWGSDWPHTEQITSVPQTATLLDQICNLLPNVAAQQLIFVDNPARLYGF